MNITTPAKASALLQDHEKTVLEGPNGEAIIVEFKVASPDKKCVQYLQFMLRKPDGHPAHLWRRSCPRLKHTRDTLWHELEGIDEIGGLLDLLRKKISLIADKSGLWEKHVEIFVVETVSIVPERLSRVRDDPSTLVVTMPPKKKRHQIN
jgi:hypothetical protein